MMRKTDICSIMQRQKLQIYRANICPRLTWLMTIQKWVQTQLEAIATAHLKKWSGLAKSANTALLYMKRADGCLNLPALTSLYKTLQVYLPGFQSLGKLFDLPVKSFKVQAVACGSFPLLSLRFVYILIPSLMHLFILFACTCLVFVAEVRVGKNERGEGWEVEGERCEG